MDWVAKERNYEFPLDSGPWSEDYPVYFSYWDGFEMDTRRHKLINCEEYDQDPRLNDMSVMAAWGTGEGLSIDGEWGVVTNRSEYGGFFSEKKENGCHNLIIRTNVNEIPEDGT